MDTVKIGKFLSELRRERGLTQEQLGGNLGVTNKTVSRWENGNYMPPVEMLMELSELYGVSINEILSGRRLESGEVQTAAEENLRSVLSDSPFSLEDRKEYFAGKWKKEHRFVFIFPSVIAVIVIIISAILDAPAGVGIGLLVPVPARIAAYNRMMAYVERNAYDGKGTPERGKL